MRVYLGSDHAGFELKEHLVSWLKENGHEVVDAGPAVYDAVDDYPPFVLRAAEGVARDPGSLGIVIGGSGNGEQIAANKVKGVRAALAWSEDTAKLAREHNDANVLGIGGRMHSLAEATRFVELFLATPYSDEERHTRRIAMLGDYEQTGELPRFRNPVSHLRPVPRPGSRSWGGPDVRPRAPAGIQSGARGRSHFEGWGPVPAGGVVGTWSGARLHPRAAGFRRNPNPGLWGGTPLLVRATAVEQALQFVHSGGSWSSATRRCPRRGGARPRRTQPPRSGPCPHTAQARRRQTRPRRDRDRTGVPYDDQE